MGDVHQWVLFQSVRQMSCNGLLALLLQEWEVEANPEVHQIFLEDNIPGHHTSESVNQK